MYTKKDLTEQIRALGILPSDTVTVHTSLKAVGAIDPGESSSAHTLISALRGAVPEGLLAIPSHTFRNIREVPVFDIRKTMPCIGAIPTVAVELANEAYDKGDNTCIRSFHLSHSVVAFGKDAAAFTKDDKDADSPMPTFGCYGKLLSRKGKVLLIGTTLASNTFIHYIDESMITREDFLPPYPVTGIDYDGTAYDRWARNCTGPKSSAASRYFTQYEPYLKEGGALTCGMVGDAETTVCDVQKMYDIIRSLHKDGFCLVADGNETPSF